MDRSADSTAQLSAADTRDDASFRDGASLWNEPAFRSTVDADSHLVSAAILGDIATVRLLSQSQASSDARQRALRLAAANGHLEIVQHLHQLGTDIRGDGDAALRLAAANNRVNVVSWLLEQGADVHANEDECMRMAAASGSLEVAHLLLEAGADCSARNFEAMRTAAARGDLAMVRLLRERGGVGPQSETATGSPLRLAASGRHRDVVRYLHETGSVRRDLSEQTRRDIEAMILELRRAHPIYQPSKFWEKYGELSTTWLELAGEQNFKRTINQIYFNVIPRSLRDPRIWSALRLWFRYRSLRPFLCYRLEDPDFDPELWFSMYDSYLLFRGRRTLQMALYKLYASSIYEYVLATDPHGTLAHLEEPLVGNPIRLFRRGRLVSLDLANSAHERNLVWDALRARGVTACPVIGELGAGYGRLAYAFLMSAPCQYLIFDIPPALAVSQYYLTTACPSLRVFRFRHFDDFDSIRTELMNADIGFFTPNQLELLPPSFFDAFVTISSLHEMKPDQISWFLQLMSNSTRHVIYLKQRLHYLNPEDGLEITRGDYTIPPGWKTVLDRRNPISPDFFDCLLERDSQAPA